MGVDLHIFIGMGYIVPRSQLNKEFWNEIGGNDSKLNISIKCQDCYGTKNFFDEPMVFIGIIKETLFSAKTGSGFYDHPNSYLTFSNGGRLPIVINLDEHGETVNKQSKKRNIIDDTIIPILTKSNLPLSIINDDNYSRWLYSYFD